MCVRDHLKLERNLGRKKKPRKFTIAYCDKREGRLAECHTQFELFTSMTKEMNSGQPRTASDQDQDQAKIL